MSDVDPFAGLTTFPSSATNTTTSSSSEPASLEQSGLGRDAFLQIFLTQLQNQDPLNPQDASQLSAQLATFSQVEQQTLMAEQLRGVNSRLDTMIQALKGGSTGSLDPLALIGKQVEVSQSSLSADADGNSTDPLVFDVTDPGLQSLLIAGKTEDDQTIGLATLGLAQGESALQRGSYELSFVGGQLQLKRPDGTTLAGNALPLTPYISDPTTGEPRSVVAGSTGAPVVIPIQPGTSQELSVGTRDGSGAYHALTPHRTGTVSAVRVVDGKQVLTVDGADTDLSNIIQVQ